MTSAPPTFVAILLSLACAACAPRAATLAPLGPGGALSAADAAALVENVRVREANVTCAQALRATTDALRTLGYTVEEVARAREGLAGQVHAVRRTGWTARSPEEGVDYRARAEIACDDAGATVTVLTQESGFARARFPGQFRDAYRGALAKARPSGATRAAGTGRVDQRREPERGLVFAVQPLRPDASLPVDGVDLRAAGLIAVRVDIRNGTDRAYGFDPQDLHLVTVQGRRGEPLSADALRQRAGAEAAAALAAATIAGGELAPGAQRSGYLFFEAATYGRATVRLIDLESDEAEGFSIRF